jgi:MFS family permease
VVLFATVTRDPRNTAATRAAPPRERLPEAFWRLLVPVAIFGAGNFATAFFTLRAAQMVQPELSHVAALTAAVGFYLAHNAVGAAVSFPAGWLADRIGKPTVLAAGYATFAAACVVGVFGHGFVALALMALFVGAQNPVVTSVESSLTSSLVEERRLGTAFGVLNAVNGVGDLASSIVAGALWTFASPAATFWVGAALCAAAAIILRVRIRS